MVPMTFAALCRYLTAPKSRPVAVTGHTAPDADAAVSCVMEGWRREVTNGTPTIPVVRCDTLPTEVAWLFGAAAPLLTRQMPTDAAAVVLTDHHVAPDLDERIVGVVDHHRPARGTDLSGTDAVIRAVGATTTIVTTAWREQELVPDAAVARILLGAILLDTDGLSPHKTTDEDVQAVTWLAALCGEQPAAFHGQLRDQLLSEQDLTTLYRRDHRTYADAGVGFAVLKVWRHALPDKDAVRHLLQQEVDAGRRLCIAKIALYDTDGLQEEYYLTAGDARMGEQLLDTVCRLSKGTAQRLAADEVLLPAGCPRHGRKWYAARWAEIFA